MSGDDGIAAGLHLEEALRIFHERVNHPDTTFAPDHWLLPHLARMRQLLADPITADQANALQDVLYDRRSMKDLIGWLEAPPMAWESYGAYKRFQEELPDNEPDLFSPLDDSPPENEAWLDTEYIEDCRKAYMQRARPCPRCQTPPEFLEWYRWKSGGCYGGSAGVATRCKFCLAEIDSFDGMTWTSGRRFPRSSPPGTVQ